MSIDWRTFCQGEGFSVEDQTIIVSLSQGRQQRVYVEDSLPRGYLRIWSIATGASAMNATAEPPEMFAWRRNHLSDLVGFKIDRKGRLIGESWVPIVGLDSHEWSIYIKALAQSCDRMEYLLTGRDQQ